MLVGENELSNSLLCASLLSRILLLQILDALASLPLLLSIYMYLQPREMSINSICFSAYQPSLLDAFSASNSKPRTSNVPERKKNACGVSAQLHVVPISLHSWILVPQSWPQSFSNAFNQRAVVIVSSLCVIADFFICSCQNNCSGANYFISTRSKSLTCDF